MAIPPYDKYMGFPAVGQSIIFFLHSAFFRMHDIGEEASPNAKNHRKALTLRWLVEISGIEPLTS